MAPVRERCVLAAAIVGGTAVVLAFQAILRRRKRNESSSKISTWVVSETLVKSPLTTAKVLRESLSEVDEWLSRSSHWLPFCLRFDSVLDAEQVRLGLERTLTHIPALGARVDTTHNEIKYELMLSPEIDHGVPFEVAHGTIASGSTKEKLQLPDESSSREEWQNAGLDAPAAGFSGEPRLDDPMMRARLTIFEADQVSYLAIGISHGLGDGHSIADILQVWSHFCTHKSPKGLPPTLESPKVFGKRITEPMRPAKTVKELEDRVQSDVGCETNPLGVRSLFKLLPRAIWCMSRQQVLELRIHGGQMAALKESVLEQLPKEEWVSRFEVLCAVLMLVERATAAEASHASEHTLHVACNLRGRVDRFPKDYLGNAAFDYRETLQLPTTASWDISNLTKFAQEIHRALRRGLKDPEDITKTKDWFEAARHLGLRNRFDIWPIVFDTFRGTGTFVNSWGPRWLDVSMGADNNARAMAAYFGVAQNLIVEVPRARETGDTTVYLALPPKQARNFIEFSRDAGSKNPPLPFTIIGHDN